MTNKSTKLAFILTAAISLAAPLALSATSADAASFHGGMQNGYGDSHYTMPVSYHDNRGFVPVSYQDNNGRGFNDRNFRPAPRNEMRMPMPHRGYHWHAGNWNFQRGHWMWAGGFWNAR